MKMPFGKKKKEELSDEEVEIGGRAGPLAHRDPDQDDDNDNDYDDEDVVYEAVDEEPSGKNGMVMAAAVVLGLVAIGGAWAKGYVSIPGISSPGAPTVAEGKAVNNDEKKLAQLGGETAPIGGDGSQPVAVIGPETPAAAPIPAPINNSKDTIATGALVGAGSGTANGMTRVTGPDGQTSMQGSAGKTQVERPTQPLVQPPDLTGGPSGLVKESEPPQNGQAGDLPQQNAQPSKKELIKQRLDSLKQAKQAAKEAKEAARLARADSIMAVKNIAETRRVEKMDSIKQAKVNRQALKADSIQRRAEGAMVEDPTLNGPGVAAAPAAKAAGDSVVKKRVRKPYLGYAYDDPRAPWNKKNSPVSERKRKVVPKAQKPYDDPEAAWNKDGSSSR